MERSCKMQFRRLYLSWLPIVCVGCQSCQQLISAVKALNKVITLKTSVLPMTMFMYILCEGSVEPKQTLFFSCCPSSHCQLLQYNQMKIEMHQYPAQNSDSTNSTFVIFWPSGCLQGQDEESQQGSSTKQQEWSLVWKMAPFLSMTSFRNVNLSNRGSGLISCAKRSFEPGDC